jgi:hypothetical protein
MVALVVVKPDLTSVLAAGFEAAAGATVGCTAAGAAGGAVG